MREKGREEKRGSHESEARNQGIEYKERENLGMMKSEEKGKRKGRKEREERETVREAEGRKRGRRRKEKK